jgi:hypothetical protein
VDKSDFPVVLENRHPDILRLLRRDHFYPRDRRRLRLKKIKTDQKQNGKGNCDQNSGGHWPFKRARHAKNLKK